MNDKRALAPWIKRFLLEYLPTDRNFARNTQHSYRDALRLFVIFSSAVLRTKPDELLVEDLSADLVRKFMRHIEEGRSARSQRVTSDYRITHAGRVYRRAQPGTSLLVCTDPQHPFQGIRAHASWVSGETISMLCSLSLTAPAGSDREITRCCFSANCIITS